MELWHPDWATSDACVRFSPWSPAREPLKPPGFPGDWGDWGDMGIFA